MIASISFSVMVVRGIWGAGRTSGRAGRGSGGPDFWYRGAIRGRGLAASSAALAAAAVGTKGGQAGAESLALEKRVKWLGGLLCGLGGGCRAGGNRGAGEVWKCRLLQK